MKRYSYILATLFLFCSCQSKSRMETHDQGEHINTEHLQPIAVHIDNANFEQLGDYLKTTSYIQLAAEPLLASIREVQIKNERIYVHDQLARIICYDMQGNVTYKLDAKGGGPNEYTDINAFLVNEQTQELIIFDNRKQALLHYNANNGAYLKTSKLGKPDPTAIASLNGHYYYDNSFHNNYPTDSAFHYSLLTSSDGIHMKQRYFPHHEVTSSYFFRTTRQPFSYNDTLLYYCKNFDNTVYELTPTGLQALYQIELPNLLPLSKIAEKPDEWELIKSDYATGLECIYQCKHLLYFQFSKNGFLHVALYDTSQRQQIYCGKRLSDKVGQSVPIFRLINGVYKGTFWGIITPETIDYALSKEPKDYPEIFRKYNPEVDNPIIAFYEVVE